MTTTPPTLYTFDYVALVKAAQEGLPGDIDRGERFSSRQGQDLKATKSWNHLVEYGLLVAHTEANPKAKNFGQPETLTTFKPTEQGVRTIASIESSWEEECVDLEWWNVSTTRGIALLGLPGVHPEEALNDLRVFYGSTLTLSPPRNEDDIPGRCKKKCPEWRPWKDASQSWVDMTEEGKPKLRGAYMRPFGDPVDPALAFMEGLGLFVPGTQRYPTIDDEVLRDIARIRYTLR